MIVTNLAPTFATPATTSISVFVSKTGNYNLPTYSDDTLAVGNITISSVEQGKAALPAFVTYKPTPKILQVAPTSESQVGSYLIDTKICDL